MRKAAYRLYVVRVSVPYPPDIVRGAMFNLMALVGDGSPVQLRAFGDAESMTYNAFVGADPMPRVRVVQAAIAIVRGPAEDTESLTEMPSAQRSEPLQ